MSSSTDTTGNTTRSLHLAQLMQQAKALKSRRTKQNTQELYEYKIKLFREWLISFPELKLESIDENEEIILPLPVRTVEAFFAEVVKKEVVNDIRNIIVAAGIQYTTLLLLIYIPYGIYICYYVVLICYYVVLKCYYVVLICYCPHFL